MIFSYIFLLKKPHRFLLFALWIVRSLNLAIVDCLDIKRCRQKVMRFFHYVWPYQFSFIINEIYWFDGFMQHHHGANNGDKVISHRIFDTNYVEYLIQRHFHNEFQAISVHWPIRVKCCLKEDLNLNFYHKTIRKSKYKWENVWRFKKLPQSLCLFA